MQEKLKKYITQYTFMSLNISLNGRVVRGNMVWGRRYSGNWASCLYVLHTAQIPKQKRNYVWWFDDFSHIWFPKAKFPKAIIRTILSFGGRRDGQWPPISHLFENLRMNKSCSSKFSRTIQSVSRLSCLSLNINTKRWQHQYDLQSCSWSRMHAPCYAYTSKALQVCCFSIDTYLWRFFPPQ
jgi:hypothetical protein